jgi:hypothetical protein
MTTIEILMEIILMGRKLGIEKLLIIIDEALPFGRYVCFKGQSFCKI